MALCTQALEHFDETCSPLLPGVPVRVAARRVSVHRVAVCFSLEFADMIFMIRPFPIISRSGFVSSTTSLFISTNQIISSYKTRRDNAFFPRPKSLAPSCART